MFGLREVVNAHAIGVDAHLRIARTISQIDEDKTAVVAIVPRPAAQLDLASHVALAQLAARGGMHAVFVPEVRHDDGSLLLGTAICICRS